ncbi:hypothetical protein GF382_01195 [Candidatus Falkowbacteria bacterium]|nr:hypothetical protein [Candidatus Falkowbacteria bacterium]
MRIDETKKVKLGAIIIAILLFVSVLYIFYLVFWADMIGGQNNQGEKVAIDKRLENKLVYTTNIDDETKYLYREDCEQRGGTFNACGTVCPEDAAICAQVCAFTCQLQDDEQKDQNGSLIWEEHIDDDLGFSIPYPDSMKVSQERANSVEFILIGSDQASGTELYDGIRVLISRFSFPQEQTLEEFSRELAKPAEGAGGKILEEVSLETEHEQFTYSFTVSSLGEYRHKVALVYPGEVFDVSYFVSGEEYEDLAEKMVDDFEVTDEQKSVSEKKGLVEVHSPKLGQSVSSPLVVEGEAKNNWFFEASFPVVLVDWDGRIMAEAPAMTSENWMSDGLHSFRSELEFDLTEENFIPRGTLIIKKSNPSGLPDNADSLEVPVYFK